MAKLAYPKNRPFIDYNKQTAYKVNRNSKFYKTLLNFQLSQLPIVELIVESYDFYTGKTVNFKGTVLEFLNNVDAYIIARRLVESEHRWGEGPLKIGDWKDGNKITMFFSKGESSDDKFLIVWTPQ